MRFVRKPRSDDFWMGWGWGVRLLLEGGKGKKKSRGERTGGLRSAKAEERGAARH